MFTRSTLNNARHLIDVLQNIKMKMRTNNQVDKHHVIDNYINGLKTSINTYLLYYVNLKNYPNESSKLLHDLFNYQKDVHNWISRSLQLISKIQIANTNKMFK